MGDRIAKIDAVGIVGDECRRVCLAALVPGRACLQHEAAEGTVYQRSLKSLEVEVLAIGVVEHIPNEARIEERNLHVVPLFLVQRAVPLQGMVEEFGLPANLVVVELVGIAHLQASVGAFATKRERDRVQATQLSTTWPHIDFDDAYAISAEGARRRVAKGAKIIGHKVGLTSKAMQRSSMIDEPDYGYLFDTLMIPDGGKARHDAYWASFTLRPGAQSVSTDVCVPISRLAECVEETQKDIAETGIPAPIVGHVGDGNFHIGLMFFPDDPQEMAKIKPFLQRLVKRALAMEGTCTGEHGIGQQKRDYMGLEHSQAALGVMRGIKQQIDPKGIMNPCKVLPDV